MGLLLEGGTEALNALLVPLSLALLRFWQPLGRGKGAGGRRGFSVNILSEMREGREGGDFTFKPSIAATRLLW